MLKKLSAFTLLVISFSSVAAQVSQAQIEQFKKLPKAQQQMLAKQMGVDLSSIERQLSGNKGNTATQQNTQSYPRGTTFDEQGNPQLQEQEKEQEEKDELTGKTLKAFGYDVFANSPQTFAPTMDIAIPSNYIMGPGDRISIQTFGKLFSLNMVRSR